MMGGRNGRAAQNSGARCAGRPIVNAADALPGCSVPHQEACQPNTSGGTDALPANKIGLSNNGATVFAPLVADKNPADDDTSSILQPKAPGLNGGAFMGGRVHELLRRERCQGP